MDYNDLDAFLAEDEKRFSEQEEKWNKQKEKLRGKRAEESAETVAVTADTVAWTCQSIKTVLEGKLDAARKDHDQVDVEKERDKKDVTYKIIILFGACLLYPLMMKIFSSAEAHFKIVLSLAFMLIGAFVIIWTLREFLNSVTKFLIRGRRRADKLEVDGLKILTYDHEKILIEEQILRINKFLKEEQELERRSENNGGLSDTDYERLQVLKYVDRQLYAGYTRDFTFMGYLRGIIGK